VLSVLRGVLQGVGDYKGVGLSLIGEQGTRLITGAILAAAGLGMADVVKTTIWLTNAEHFGTVNEIYARHLPAPAPARSAPVVASLPHGFLISIEAIARR